MNHAQFWGGAAAAPYEIEQSLRFDGSSSFTRTNGTPDSTSVTTFSCWIKKATPVITGNQQLLFYGTFPYQSYINFTTGGSSYSDNLSVLTYANSNTGYTYTNALLRDPSAWYHIVLKKNGTTVQWYINGELQSTTQSGNNGSNTTWNGNGVAASFGSGFNGYIAEVVFVDNQDLDPTNFGEPDNNGVWRPIRYTGTFGSQGWYLKFDPSATNGIGHDHSGNGNNWTPSAGFTTSGTGTDVMSDTPTTNWCTWNPLSIASPATLSDGNLVVNTGGSGGGYTYGTFALPTSGKWYWEIEVTLNASLASTRIGIGNITLSKLVTYYNNGNKSIDGVDTSYGASYTDNDIIGVAYDSDGGTITFYKNNSSQGGISYSLGSETLFPMIHDGSGSYGLIAQVNFGQRAFQYSPPTNFLPLNTSNLPAPDIAKGSKYFNTVLYTGTAATQSIPNVGFQPDLIWIKARNGAYSHNLTDAVRGITNGLTSNDTIAEYTIGLTSFDTDGFSMGAGNNQINGSTITYAAWNWKEGATQGFDIVSYTGTGANRTVSHNLGVQPSLIIVKNRDRNAAWAIYHSSLGATKVLQFDANGAFTDSTSWNNTSPTSSVFTVGTANSVNALNEDLIAYCFAEVEGYSKFGSYTGNGSTSANSGPFVYLGFKPSMVIIKRTDGSGGGWAIWDNKRNTYNIVDNYLFPNTSGSEADGNGSGWWNLDFLSNGFRVQSFNESNTNASGGNYIFAAFAENPFGGSGVSPATAR